MDKRRHNEAKAVGIFFKQIQLSLTDVKKGTISLHRHDLHHIRLYKLNILAFDSLYF